MVDKAYEREYVKRKKKARDFYKDLPGKKVSHEIFHNIMNGSRKEENSEDSNDED